MSGRAWLVGRVEPRRGIPRMSVVSDVAAPMARETKTNITTALLTTQPSSTLPIHHSTPLYGRGSKEAEITTVEYRGSIFNDSS